MEDLATFFDSPFFAIVRGVSTSIIIITTIAFVWGTFRGFIPVLWRLGKSLNKRKIALYAESNATSLRNLLQDSKFIKRKNIETISKAEIKKGAENSMMIIYYPDFKDQILEILNHKKDSDSLIIYAPQSEGRIDQEIMDKVCDERNTIITNMRGRLLNDVITAMITTKYA